MKVLAIQMLPHDFESLVQESLSEGHNFLQKMQSAWLSGANRFDKAGEIVFAVFDEKQKVLGICGLNIDPYVNQQGIGRVRHLYVAHPERQKGLGRNLVKEIISHGEAHFSVLRLRTENPIADRFYQSLGFKRSDEQPDATHLWNY
jgi:N-acetylglutamate synthase-like GNAT family acetyltransferase